MDSVLNIFKIGVGPSSSHTMGPWNAALAFRKEVLQLKINKPGCEIVVDLYGSLALTGIGHGTDFAVYMGLQGFKIDTIVDDEIIHHLSIYQQKQDIEIGSLHIQFECNRHINFWKKESLPFHPNGMRLNLIDGDGQLLFRKTYYSTGGGFIVEEGHVEDIQATSKVHTFHPDWFLAQYKKTGKSLVDLILANELQYHSLQDIEIYLDNVFHVMKESAFYGCKRSGPLPGGLNVMRRAKAIQDQLLGEREFETSDEWMQTIRQNNFDFRQTIRWINCFALAVNEQNASFGRVVTAPTNGASGVIPSVLLYLLTQFPVENERKLIHDFLLVSGLIGMMYKRGATLSAAAGGCQAEIGVSSSMAAAGIVAIQGGTIPQIFMAAEIAMEHHLGLTCDPIKGLVQIPCIERNSIGAVKAITSAQLALSSEPSHAKVSLSEVIESMWQTAQDMNEKYKETSLGGLAVNVLLPEC